MGQIFNRVFKIAKSYMNDSDLNNANKIINEESEDLKKIIDDLNSSKSTNSHKNKEKKDDFHKKENASNNDNTKKELNIENAYLILGINSKSSIEEIKSAYKSKMKEYHPDKVSGLGKEIQDLAQSKTQEINEAYSIIRKSKNF